MDPTADTPKRCSKFAGIVEHYVTFAFDRRYSCVNFPDERIQLGHRLFCIGLISLSVRWISFDESFFNLVDDCFCVPADQSQTDHKSCHDHHGRHACRDHHGRHAYVIIMVVMLVVIIMVVMLVVIIMVVMLVVIIMVVMLVVIIMVVMLVMVIMVIMVIVIIMVVVIILIIMVVIIVIARVECATLAEFDQLQVVGFGQFHGFASDATNWLF